MKKISIFIVLFIILSAIIFWRSVYAPIIQTDGEANTPILCDESQRNADLCIQIYDPVCALVQIQCITTPCNPIEQTFSNSCEACQNSLVLSYVKGDCK